MKKYWTIAGGKLTSGRNRAKYAHMGPAPDRAATWADSLFGVTMDLSVDASPRFDGTGIFGDVHSIGGDVWRVFRSHARAHNIQVLSLDYSPPAVPDRASPFRLLYMVAGGQPDDRRERTK